MTQSQSLCNCLSALGLKQEMVHGLVDSVVRWRTSNGPEWTISRLKDLKLYYLHRLAGEEYKFSGWVARRPDGRPKGPFGSLSLSTPRDIMKTFAALNVYTIFVAHSPTEKQLKKFLGSVESGNPISVDPDRVGFYSSFQGKERLGLPKPWNEHVWSSQKRAPLSDGSTVPESDTARWLIDNGKQIGSFASHTFFKPSPYHDILKAAKLQSFVKFGTRSPVSGGKVSFLQEPGYKLRGIANPYRMWQVLLDPLKDWGFRTLRGIPEDCTYDQDKGVRFAADALKRGKTVHSVDLSDATNLFPLDYQLEVLGSHLDLLDETTRKLVELFVRASRSVYQLPDGRSIRWDRGQPLGLGPSFAVFALSHHSVVKTLQEKHGGDFAILGDDIVIVGDDLCKAYRQRMLQLGCSISEDKSFSSNTVAEFAGKIITADAVIPQIKWRAVSDRNFLDILRNIGPTALGLLRPRQRRVAKELLSMPEWLGGLGWNPKGIPLDDRLDQAVRMGLLDDRPEEVTLRSSSSTLRRTLNEVSSFGMEGVPYLLPEDTEPTPTSTRGRIPKLWSLLGIDEVLAPLSITDGDFKPGVRSGDPRGPTTLEVLERKVKKLDRKPDVLDVVTLDRPFVSSRPESKPVPRNNPEPESETVVPPSWEGPER